MTATLAVLGNMPAGDRLLFERYAHSSALTICMIQPGAPVSEDDLPIAYISYLPCRPDTIIDLYGSQPIGFGEKMPFFQCLDSQSVPSFLQELPLWGVFTTPLTEASAFTLITSVLQGRREAERNTSLMGEVMKYRKQKYELIQVGTAMSHENDLGRLLEVILSISRDLVDADAGSVYIRERSTPGGPLINQLRFKVAQNDSVRIERQGESSLPMNENSIAGYVALTGRVLNIDDVARLDSSVPYHFSKDFERKFGYRVKSMLTVPLRNRTLEVVGVLQLMNRKRERSIALDSPGMVDRFVTSFALTDEDLVMSIASHAAVSIERAQLYENIRELFEGFLSASIAAIDERDRVTSGHSRRVMGYALAFADAAASVPDCQFAQLCQTPERRRQFQFSALLHDIGKIGVPERVLTKEARLPQGELAAILSRFDYVALLQVHSPASVSWTTAQEVENDREFIRKVNAAGYIGDDDFGRLTAFRERWYCPPGSERRPFLTVGEWEALSVRGGNLTPSERSQINSHAEATYRILSKIPWTKQLERIPDIASHHHEKLDGSGYPDGLKGEQISLESRVLAVVDIYEALVAQDRPYKPKMPAEKALAILNEEVARGHLDGDVVRFFIEKGIYRLYL